jgi:hypothetical protein
MVRRNERLAQLNTILHSAAQADFQAQIAL